MEREDQALQPIEDVTNPERKLAQQVIYLSGMPGAGKTTVATALADTLHGTLIDEFTEPIPDWVIQTRPEDTLEAKLAAQRWTLTQHTQKNDRIKDLDGTFIVDRTWLDSIIYAGEYGEETTQRLTEEVKQQTWAPGLHLALVVNPEVCKARLQPRIGVTDEVWDSTWKPFVTNLYDTTIRIAELSNIEVIDTSNIDEQEMIDTVEAKFHAHFKDQALNRKYLSAQEHLNAAGVDYLNAINGTTPESLLSAIQALSPLVRHLPHPESVVSIGVGQGEEVHALSELYKNTNARIFGVDLSSVALHAARERAQRNNLAVEFIIGSATSLPFSDETIDGIVLSSVLHEVYSYFPRGKEAWETAIQEAVRVLTPDGSIYLRDPAAPEMQETVSLTCKSDLAQKFYAYYRKAYRTFQSWDTSMHNEIEDKRTPNQDDYPALDENLAADLQMSSVADFLLHFRNFWNDFQRGTAEIGDPDWKEMDETYFIPQETKSGNTLNIDEYVARVISIGNEQLQNSPYEITCIQQQTSFRPNTDTFLSEHFSLSHINDDGNNSQDSLALISQATQKMELIFKKSKKEV